jgi:lysozyme family protein
VTPQIAIENLLKLEGISTTNIVNDRGGLTTNGIENTEFNTWLAKHGQPGRPVSTITMPETIQLYTEEYWIPGYCGSLPDGLDFVHFQWAANHGLNGSAKCLQAALDVRPVDGLIGPETIQATQHMTGFVLERYLAIQSWCYVHFIEVDQTQLKFFNGWENRITRVRDILAGRPLSV